MKSDSLMKAIACMLAFSLIFTTGVAPANAMVGDVVGIEQQEGLEPATTEDDLDEVKEVLLPVEEDNIQGILQKVDQTEKSSVALFAGEAVDSTNDQKKNDITNGNNNEGQNETQKETEKGLDQQVEGQTKDIKEETPKEKDNVSEYDSIGISVADPYVNVRKKANVDSDITGKLYKGNSATIISKSGEWVQIESGNVKGYVKLEYLAIGEDAKKLVDTYATKYATVRTITLNVREKKDDKSRILTQIPEDETYLVKKEYEEWIYISIDDGDIEGYVKKEYVDIKVEFKKGITLEEEAAAETAKAERERLSAEEEKKATANKTTTTSETTTSNNKGNSSSNNNSHSSEGSSNSNSGNSDSSSESISSSSSNSSGCSSVVEYAKRFVGNPYVYEGTSLTNGTDCSGFTQSIFRKFGYSLDRTSRDQYASAGTIVSVGSIQPGDLLFYTNSSGTVNHVAIYIGNGKIVHASNPSDGIKISSYNYRTPCRARRVIN